MSYQTEEIVAKIKPYVLGWIRDVGASQLGAHDLGGRMHTGTVLDSQAPQFLKLDGSRALTGNLGVSAGATIDGVDLSVFKADFDGHVGGNNPHTQYALWGTAGVFTATHTFNPGAPGAPFVLGANAQGQTVVGLKADQVARSVAAGTGLTGGGVLTADRTLGLNLAANLTWTGNEAFQGGLTTRSIVPETSDGYDLGAADKLWRRAYISELDTFLLKQNAVSVVGGRLMITKGEGALPTATAAAATSIDFGSAMTANDVVLFRTAGAVEYVKVIGLVAGTTYTVTRNLDGSGANDWAAGSVWVNLGAYGAGRIELDADLTPRISIKQQGLTYNTFLEPVRIGDLNGWDTVGTERYGIGIGDFASGNYLRYDGVFTIRAGGNAVSLDASGVKFLAAQEGEGTWMTGPSSVNWNSLNGGNGYAALYGSNSPAFSKDMLATLWVTGDSATLNSSGSVLIAATKQTSVSPSTLRTTKVNLSVDYGLVVDDRPIAGAPFAVSGFGVQGFAGYFQNGAAFKSDNTTLFSPVSGILNVQGLRGFPVATNPTRRYGMGTLGMASLCMDLYNPRAVWVGYQAAAGAWRVNDLSGNGYALLASGAMNGDFTNVNAMMPQGMLKTGSAASYLYYATPANLSVTNFFTVGGWFYIPTVGATLPLVKVGDTTYSWKMQILNGVPQIILHDGTADRTVSAASVAVGWHYIGFMFGWVSAANYAYKICVDGAWTSYSGTAPAAAARAAVGNFTIFKDGALGYTDLRLAALALLGYQDSQHEYAFEASRVYFGV